MGDSFYYRVLYNSEAFMQSSFDADERLIKKSVLGSILATSRDATFVDGFVNLTELTDEIDFFSIGQQNSVEFQSVSYGTPQPSLFNDWPTLENPFGEYKFIGIWLELAQSKTTIERTTYNALEWVGDVGGLFDGFRLIVSSLIAPITGYAVKTAILSAGFNTISSGG